MPIDSLTEDIAPRAANRDGKGRKSEPKTWTPQMTGGVGIVARRGSKHGSRLMSPEGVEGLARNAPLKLLQELPAVHPTVGFAQWGALRSMFPRDGWGFRAHKPTADPDSVALGEQDPKGTKSVAEMVKQLPREIGGLRGMACTLAISLLLTGMAAVECVPYDSSEKSFSGVRRIWPVDTLTIGFGRENRDDDLQPYQLQRWPGDGKRGASAFINRWVPMNVNTFFWTAIDQQVDDPYGLPPYGTSANEVLADLALMRDLRDAVHNAAWPRMKVGVNLAELHKVAVEVYRITDPKAAAAWVQERFDRVVEYVEALAPDDNIVCDTSGEVKAHEPGSFTGLEGVLAFLRQRLVQALKTLPTLIGINDGSTYNYTSVEWAIYAAGLEALRDIVLDLMADAFTKHLQLQGSDSIVAAWAEKIRTNDALVDANTEEVVTRNAAVQWMLGFLTQDEASQKVTKRGAVKKVDDEILHAFVGAGGKGDKDGDRKTGNAGQGGANKGNNEGTSREEREAKGAKK